MFLQFLFLVCKLLWHYLIFSVWYLLFYTLPNVFIIMILKVQEDNLQRQMCLLTETVLNQLYMDLDIVSIQ